MMNITPNIFKLPLMRLPYRRYRPGYGPPSNLSPRCLVATLHWLHYKFAPISYQFLPRYLCLLPTKSDKIDQKPYKFLENSKNLFWNLLKYESTWSQKLFGN